MPARGTRLSGPSQSAVAGISDKQHLDRQSLRMRFLMSSPIFFLKGTDIPALQESNYGEECKHYDPPVGAHFNKKGYCNEGTTVRCIIERLVPAFTSC